MKTSVINLFVCAFAGVSLAACSVTKPTATKSSTAKAQGSDINNDSKTDAKDVDILLSNKKFNKDTYASKSDGDLNGDHRLDILDVAIMLSNLDDITKIPGDANSDGVVDVLDSAQVLAAGKFATNQSATWAEGDFDGDGKVTDDDMRILQASIHGVVDGLAGDCTGDGLADGSDLNKFTRNYNKFDGVTTQATASDCDFNGDKVIDILDLMMITNNEIEIDTDSIGYGPINDLADLGNELFRPGDANKDGKINSEDSLQVISRGKFDKGAVGATWEDGDFNGDGAVDVLDSAIILANMDVQSQLPGDANSDGKVNQDDAEQLVKAGKYDTGLAATWADGDFNSDGVVDILDMSIFVSHYGK